MKQSMSKNPVAAFTLPPHPPQAAAAAIAKFTRLGDDWGRTLGEIADAEEAVEREKAEAKAAVVEAAKAGRSTTVSVVAVERKFADRVAELRAKADALAVAVDQAGDEMAVGIAEYRGEWLVTPAEVAAEAEARYARALEEARAALVELAPARGAVEWLTEFNHSEARVGQQQQFSGGRVTVDTTAVRRDSNTRAEELLDLLATVTAKPQPAQSRRHRVAVR